MINLVNIDKNNWRKKIDVNKEQEIYVANQVIILARAYAYKDDRSRAFYLMDDNEIIGIGLYYDYESKESYILSEMFIDKKFQGKGYGKKFLQLILDELRQDKKYKKVILCLIEGNIIAEKMYLEFGFKRIDQDVNEIIMELTL